MSVIGLYSGKSVRGIGKVSNIIEADLLEDELRVKSSSYPVNDSEITRIKQVIHQAKKNNNWDIASGHKFFCVEKFYPTDFRKATKFPLQGKKNFNLKLLLGISTLPSVEEISGLLREKTW